MTFCTPWYPSYNAVGSLLIEYWVNFIQQWVSSFIFTMTDTFKSYILTNRLKYEATNNMMFFIAILALRFLIKLRFPNDVPDTFKNYVDISTTLKVTY